MVIFSKSGTFHHATFILFSIQAGRPVLSPKFESQRGMEMSENQNRYELNKQLAQMLKGGVIMDVTTPEQA